MRATPYLDLYRAEFGRAHKISRAQLQALLLKLADRAGLDLRGHAGWYGVRETESLATIARAIANAPQGITVLSLGGQVRDIQYDEPGSMHPAQQAELSFVSPELASYEYDQVGQMRRHAARLVFVTGEPLAVQEPKSESHLLNYECDNGHRWQLPESTPEEDTRCPVCGEWWV
jgi:hypothetical protein